MTSSNIVFLADITADEARKIHVMIEQANRLVEDYFGITCSFDVVVCRGSWEMEVQIISRRGNYDMMNGSNVVGLTDYRLGEIVIRFDAARFGHYLHELVHGIMSAANSHQLREGMAWYFTEKLIAAHRYAGANPPVWAEDLYVRPVRKLARILGDDFLKDLALGKADVETSRLPADVKDLFLPEALFYEKRRYQK
jgi:hypothetical protein